MQAQGTVQNINTIQNVQEYSVASLWVEVLLLEEIFGMSSLIVEGVQTDLSTVCTN